MEKLLISEEPFTAFLVNEVKVYAEKWGTPAATAFKDIVDKWFFYSDNQIVVHGHTARISQKNYYKSFCKFITAEVGYMGFIPDEYFNLIMKYYGYIRTFPTLDKEYLELLREAVAEEQRGARELEERTQEILRVLKHQFLPDDKMFGDVVKALKLNGISNYFLLVDIYNYGYIQGKRAERAKKGV